MTTRLAQCTIALLLAAGILFAGPPVEPFNGKNLDGWNLKHHGKGDNHWTVGTAAISTADPRELTASEGGNQLINVHGHGQDLFTKQTFRNVVVELEVMVPKGSNSGIYLMGEYEVQVLDSFGKDKPNEGDMGAIYGIHAPKNPPYRAPGQWNTFRIDFQAPRFDGAGKKIASAKFIKVELNGKVIHENVEVPAPTRSALTGKERPAGPLMLQGDHGPVAYRNLRITPRD
ncbi:DUF1080 domain-containing protein [Planctomycetales bacterium ZRK34]|nr:DUF1080 domain-containing protein [Planctomycetales bacterium ZRK34]